MLSRCSRALSASVKIGLVRSNIGRFLLMHPYRPNRFLRQVYNRRQAMLRPLLLASVFALAAPAGAQEVIDDMAPPVTEGVAAPGAQAQTDQTARKSVVKGQRVSVRVELGGRRLITKKK